MVSWIDLLHHIFFFKKLIFITPICFLAKASPTQAWFWQSKAFILELRLLHSLLSKERGCEWLTKLKYVKDQLCLSCEMSKAKRSSFKTKTVPSSKGRLNFLHMDLFGPMRIASINEEETGLGVLEQEQLHGLFQEEGIEHQTSHPRNLQQKRRCRIVHIRTFVEFRPRTSTTEMSVENVSSGLVPQGEKASDYDNSDPVWLKIRILCGMDSIDARMDGILAFLIPISKGRSVVSIIARVVVATTAYFLWKERNSRLFSKKILSIDNLVESICSTVRLKLVTFKFKKISSTSRLLLDLWKVPKKCIDHDGSAGWVPTGKTFASSTTKVESEPPNGSNADIPNQCESEQALNVSAGTLLSTAVQASVINVKWCLLKITLQAPFLNVQMTFEHSSSSLGHQCQMVSAENNTSGPVPQSDQASVFMAMMSVHISSGLVLHQMTSDHNRSELRIQDHSNEPSSSKLVPKVVPLAVKTATS
ncbi:hypothetical protein Tco_1134238 [Tanacetum coccineum]